MNLEERKNQLMSLLHTKGIDTKDKGIHKNLIHCEGSSVYILSNFGNQIKFNGSKNSIGNIRSLPLDKIKYNSLVVDFFAIPAYGKGKNGKRTELCNEWCFIPSTQIYNSIKVYVDHADSTWAKSPISDWAGNINDKEFYWKSDASKHREEIQWNNFDSIISVSHDEIENDINNINTDISLSLTEKNTLIKARKGQGKYRDSLINYWSACAVTNCSNLNLLRASHIKPWKNSNNDERLDPFNGFLLTANFDLLFDQGFISFCNEGKIIISNSLDQQTLDILGIDKTISVNIVKEHVPYLEFHRKMVLRNEM